MGVRLVLPMMGRSSLVLSLAGSKAGSMKRRVRPAHRALFRIDRCAGHTLPRCRVLAELPNPHKTMLLLLKVPASQGIADYLGGDLKLAEVITPQFNIGQESDFCNFLSKLQFTLRLYPVGENQLILFKC